MSLQRMRLVSWVWIRAGAWDSLNLPSGELPSAGALSSVGLVYSEAGTHADVWVELQPKATQGRVRDQQLPSFSLSTLKSIKPF